MVDPQLIWTVGTAVFVGGAAWGGSKVAMNGTRERVKQLERASEFSASAQTDMRERLVRVETTLNHIAEKIDRL